MSEREKQEQGALAAELLRAQFQESWYRSKIREALEWLDRDAPGRAHMALDEALAGGTPAAKG